MSEKRLSRTQPSCLVCFEAQNPGRRPAAFRPEMREVEICCFCGTETSSGVYVRVDPTSVLHPTLTKD